ncbi:hypothetical protein BJ085DRAFT_40396, partial [Dimargaris cristalligena]
YAFNYLGQVDASGVKSTSKLFSSRADITSQISQLGLENSWSYLIDFICFHDQDQLVLNVGYSSEVFSGSNMTTLAESWKQHLEELIHLADEVVS